MSSLRVGAAPVSGRGGGPPNGAMIASERNTSGRVSAHHEATEAPKSCPTTAAAEEYPSAAVSPSVSRAKFSMRNEARSPS